MATEKVIVEIGAKDTASGTIDKVAKATEKFGDKAQSGFQRAAASMKDYLLQGVGIGAGIAIFNHLSTALQAVVAAGMEAQESAARLNATLAAIGPKGEAARATIEKVSAQMLKLGFDDDDAAESMARLLQRTGDVAKAQEYMGLAADLARAKQIDLGAATDLVGQVLAGNGRVLKQYGIDINEAATPMQALSELQEKVKGQAEAYGNTFSGQVERLKNTWSNFLEEVGVPLLENLTKLLDKFLDWIDSIGGAEGIISNFKLAIQGLMPVLELLGSVGSVQIKIIQDVIFYTYLGWLKLQNAIVNGTIIVQNAWKGMMTGMQSVTSSIWESIKGFFVSGINWVIGKMNSFIRSLGSVTGVLGKAIGIKNLGFSEIPSLASGGIVKATPGGTLAVIGEGGRDEAVVPLGKGTSGLGGITIVLSDNNFYGDDETFAQKVADQIFRTLEPHLNYSAT